MQHTFPRPGILLLWTHPAGIIFPQGLQLDLLSLPSPHVCSEATILIVSDFENSLGLTILGGILGFSQVYRTIHDIYCSTLKFLTSKCWFSISAKITNLASIGCSLISKSYFAIANVLLGTDKQFNNESI